MRPLASLLLALVALAAVVAAPAAAAPRPDLRQAAPVIAPPRDVATGGALTVTDLVRNGGRRRARASRTHFFLSRDRVAGLDDVATGARSVPALRPRRSSRRTLVLRMPAAAAPGTWTLIACADATNRVRERRERDNCRASVLPVRIPAPVTPQQPQDDPPIQPPQQPPFGGDVLPPPPDGDPDPEPDSEPEPSCPSSTDVRTIAEALPGAADATPTADPTEFTAMWASTRTGWTGGDGTFSARLPDGRIVWLFGDTYLGGIRDDGTRDPAAPMVRNSLVVQDGSTLTTHVRGTQACPLPFLAPGGSTTSGHWYWPNQAIVDEGDPATTEDDRLHTFWTLIAPTGPGPLDVAIAGTTLATFALPDLTLARNPDELPARDGLFHGAAIVEQDDYTYLFGVDDTSAIASDLHVARVPAASGLDDLTAIEFWSGGGSGWTTDVDASNPVLVAAVSNQLSIVPRGSALLLVSQVPLSEQVKVWRATDVTGPWEPAGEPGNCPAPAGGLSYNALLHPWSVDANGKMLLSCNVNAVDAAAVHADPSLYRPRFDRVFLPAG